MGTRGKYLNNTSHGLAHEMVACFYNFCVVEKKAKKKKAHTIYGYNFQYGCVLTVANMTSQGTRFPTLIMPLEKKLTRG